MALRTTLIVGYPGETDKDFQLLYDFVEEVKFHRLGIFTYSQEDGTSAYLLGDPVPAEVKEERRGILMELQRKISESRNESSIGSHMKVLIDRKEDGLYVGRTEWDAPEIDQEVFVDSTKDILIGNFYEVKITGSTEYDLYATPA